MKTNLNTFLFSVLALATSMPVSAYEPIKMVDIPAGHFYMGGRGTGDEFDEAPIHRVNFSKPFKMSATEITNAQFEQLMPGHRELRGKNGLSTGDDEAVVNVSYNDAVEFCRRLSEKEGKTYRLPTEAEWEYACKAGTYTLYYTGDGLPDIYCKSQRVTRDFDPISLEVGKTPANAFGLFDMHGNVEEWCLDYYGMYDSAEQTDPCGLEQGVFRVTRGGSHHTPVKYLRSTNRMAMLPDDRHCQTGFRIVESDVTLNHSGVQCPAPINRTNVSHVKFVWANPTEKPVFMKPIPFVIAPSCGNASPFYRHNHQPAVTWCDNGDLLAIWFTANEENGREMTVLGSRLRAGASQWDEASEFFRVPDRNLTGSSLLNDRNGRLIHINGMEASGDWQNLAMVMRTSNDNGATWSTPRLIAHEHEKRHQVIQGPSITSEGYIIQACDAGPDGQAGSALHISRDGGNTWEDTGSKIAGIHAGVVQLSDGSLMAFGRGNSIPDNNGKQRMPMSVSHDMGKTWEYSASPFPPIDGGQRLVLMRLNEGPLLLVSFTDHPQRTPEADRGMVFTDNNGNAYKGYGMYAALSFDEGKTWPVRKLMTDGSQDIYDGGAWTGFFETGPTQAEPRGYLAGTQTPDNMIHILSSRLHYRFNLPWLLQ